MALRNVQVELEFGNVGFFMEGGKPEYLEKNPWSKDENQQQTQPTYDTGTGNKTPATLVEGECSHHCAIPAPLLSGCSVIQVSAFHCRIKLQCIYLSRHLSKMDTQVYWSHPHMKLYSNLSVDLICIFTFTENCVSPWPSVNIAPFLILSMGTFFVKHQSCLNKYKNIFIVQSSKGFSAAFHWISSR